MKSYTVGCEMAGLRSEALPDGTCRPGELAAFYGYTASGASSSAGVSFFLRVARFFLGGSSAAGSGAGDCDGSGAGSTAAFLRVARFFAGLGSAGGAGVASATAGACFSPGRDATGSACSGTSAAFLRVRGARVFFKAGSAPSRGASTAAGSGSGPAPWASAGSSSAAGASVSPSPRFGLRCLRRRRFFLTSSDASPASSAVAGVQTDSVSADTSSVSSVSSAAS